MRDSCQNVPFHLLQIFIYIIQFRQNMFTDESTVDLFVIVGEKVPKTGYGGKPVGETGFQYPIRAENVEHLGIRLGRPEFSALYQQFTENDAAVGQEVQVMNLRSDRGSLILPILCLILSISILPPSSSDA